ncbi:hypothetical protein TNCV_3796491 [Trichonephila clavipes]|nr:hypothetical protein TNCV_3796491 [Trichonephila clavipes]
MNSTAALNISHGLVSSLETPWCEAAQLLCYASPHTGPAADIKALRMILDFTAAASHFTHCRFAGTAEVPLRCQARGPFIHSVLYHQLYSNRIMRDLMWCMKYPRVIIADKIELLPLPACSPELSPIDNPGSMLALRLTRDTSHSAATIHWQYLYTA